MFRLVGARIDWRLVEGEIIALDLQSSQYLSINATGAAIWPQLASGVSLEAMVVTIRDQFNVDAERAAADVTAFVDELDEIGLIERGADAR